MTRSKPVLLFAVVIGLSSLAHPCLGLTLGAYYYPWYRNDFHGGNYLREHLIPRQYPTLGEYNDRDPAVIKQHADWSRYAGIEVWVASWWGPGSREDSTLLNNTLASPDLGDIKIAVLYETAGRTSEFTRYDRIGPDFEYLAQNYFSHDNYYKIDGKPVVMVYLTRVLSSLETLATAVGAMRTAASAHGFEVYILGDQVFGHPPSGPGDMNLLDAVTEYDVYGSIGIGGYAMQAGVDAYSGRQDDWKSLADGAGVGFVPAVTPGFNDKGVREGHAPVSRRLAPGEEHGSLFRALIRAAKGRVDPRSDGLLLITSWNEWHEDTQIEPVEAAPATTQDDSPSGTDYTTGLDYEGYGLKYLDILREESGNKDTTSWQVR